MKSFSETASVEGFSVLTSHKRIQEAVDAGNFVVAKDELEKVDRHTNELDADWRAIFEALRVKADQGYAKSQVTVNYGAGTQVLDNKLKLYETSHLNPPSRAKARVFVQRAKDWLDTYPGHPSSGWVEAKMRRYTTVAQPNTPPTFEDVSWEIRMLAGDKVWPRDYKTAFQKLDTYRTMNPDDVNQVDSLAADLRTTRQEVFTERMDLVAVETLVQIIVKFDDTDLCNQAADLLVSMEGLVKYVRGEKRRYEIQSSMRGYRNERPEYYEKLKQHPTMASFFAKHSI